MPDWIKVRADEIRRKAEEDQQEKKRKTDAAVLLKEKTAPFWNSLVSDLKEAVRRFNEEFPEKERQIDPLELTMGTGMVIRRAAYPAVTVKIQLTQSGTSVNYTISQTKRRGADATEQHSAFAFGVVEGEVAYLGDTLKTNQDVAMIFLEPFFEF